MKRLNEQFLGDKNRKYGKEFTNEAVRKFSKCWKLHEKEMGEDTKLSFVNSK